MDEDGITVAAADGQVRIKRLRPDKGKKVGAGEWAKESGIKKGARFV